MGHGEASLGEGGRGHDTETALVRRYIQSCECKTSRPRSNLIFTAARGVEAPAGGGREEGMLSEWHKVPHLTFPLHPMYSVGQ